MLHVFDEFLLKKKEREMNGPYMHHFIKALKPTPRGLTWLAGSFSDFTESVFVLDIFDFCWNCLPKHEKKMPISLLKP